MQFVRSYTFARVLPRLFKPQKCQSSCYSHHSRSISSFPNITLCNVMVVGRNHKRYIETSAAIKPKLIEDQQESNHESRNRINTTGYLDKKGKFIINYAKINTCSHMKTNGLHLDVGYIDTAPNAPMGTPTILALHGTPGKSAHFKELLQILSVQNCRVIAPDFPGCGHTKLDVKANWKHTPEEKEHFIMDFLDALDISRVDVLVPHSSAIYPSLRLFKAGNNIGSLVLVNPGVHKLVRVLRPAWLTSLVVLLGKSIFRPLVIKGVQSFVKINGGPHMAQIDPETLLMSYETLLAPDLSEMQEQLKGLSSQSIPISLFISANDLIVSTKLSLEFATLLNIKEENVTVIGKTGEVKRERKQMESSSPHRTAFLLEKGTHFGMRVYPELVCNTIMDIVKRIT